MNPPATGSRVLVQCGPYGDRTLTVVQAAAGEHGIAVHAETSDCGGLQAVYTLTPAGPEQVDVCATGAAFSTANRWFIHRLRDVGAARPRPAHT